MTLCPCGEGSECGWKDCLTQVENAGTTRCVGSLHESGMSEQVREQEKNVRSGSIWRLQMGANL